MNNFNYANLSSNELDDMEQCIKKERRRRQKDAEKKEEWDALASAIHDWCKKYGEYIYVYENGGRRCIIKESSNCGKPGSINTQY